MDIEVKNEKKKPQLKDHELKALIQKSQDGDQQARDTIVQSNMRLVWSVVQRFLNRGYEPDDLFQIGCIGLLKSVDKFDLSFDVKFSTYAGFLPVPNDLLDDTDQALESYLRQ
ncbi:sigma-70 family RNA polymerase sigma factor, partial [Bacillus sp. HC-Mk]